MQKNLLVLEGCGARGRDGNMHFYEEMDCVEVALCQVCIIREIHYITNTCTVCDLFREGIGKHYVDSTSVQSITGPGVTFQSIWWSWIDYLGMWMSDDLKWSKHIEQITKAGWANFTGGSVPILILSHWNNCICLRWDIVWSMQLLCGILTASLYRGIGKGPEVCPYDCLQILGYDSYETLLLRSGLQQLSECKVIFEAMLPVPDYKWKLCFPKSSHCETSTGTQLQNVTYHFLQLFARTSAYQYSFFPNTISDWNSLPASIRSCPSITAFKYI